MPRHAGGFKDGFGHNWKPAMGYPRCLDFGPSIALLRPRGLNHLPIGVNEWSIDYRGTNFPFQITMDGRFPEEVPAAKFNLNQIALESGLFPDFSYKFMANRNLHNRGPKSHYSFLGGRFGTKITWALRLIGETHSHPDAFDAEKSEDHYRQALALSEELGMRPLIAHCRKGLGALYGRTGQEDKAREELTTAMDMYRDMEMTFWLEKAEEAMAKVVLSRR
jgi:hypothetical protein